MLNGHEGTIVLVMLLSFVEDAANPEVSGFDFLGDIMAMAEHAPLDNAPMSLLFSALQEEVERP